MYKGKFDQKKKKTSADIHEIVSQRNAEVNHESIPQRKPAPQAAPVKKNPAAEMPKQQKKAAPVPEVPEKKRKGPVWAV